MITLYWVLEYGKVLCGYLFVMFLWPSVIFHKHLHNKTYRYRFAFCVTTQIVLINTVVLALGLLHILNRYVIVLLYYGSFFYVILRKARINHGKVEQLYRVATGVYGVKSFLFGNLKKWAGQQLGKVWRTVRPRLLEYVVLSALLLYGMIYFTYGTFRDYSYGASDMYVHHQWIYGLIEGQAFSGKVYPEAMHCFIYCIYAVCNIKVHSILLFLAGIHITVFLISAYSLMREVFHWRYSPFLALAVFLTLDMSVSTVESMSRLQWTLPQEFALFTQFLCALYLFRYLKSTHRIVRKGKISRNCWDENLYIFMMALAVSIATHFYATILAFFLCVAFAVCGMRKILTKGHFLPLTAAVLCGVLIAAAPMLGALASGIPFQGSIGWAMRIMRGEDKETDADDGSAEEETEGTDGAQGTSREQDIPEGQGAGEKQDAGGSGSVQGSREARGKQELKENPPSKEELSDKITRWAGICENKLRRIYYNGYSVFYGRERAEIVVNVIMATAILWLLYRLSAMLLSIPFKGRINTGCFDGYPPVILASFIYMTAYVASSIGLPQLVDRPRICSSAQMINIMITVMWADMLLSLLALFCRDWLLQILSAVGIGGICTLIATSDIYHGYLYSNLTSYNSVEMVTSSIIRTLPKHSYTIVSPTEELYQVIQYGRHEELLTFIQSSEKANYTLPTEYVFLYVEKRPLQYVQLHFASGPSWLALEKYADAYGGARVSQCPDIIASEISTEAAQKDVMTYANAFWSYTRIESRTILESKAYEWCRRFSELYPFELNVYYEDEDFVCYYFRQEPNAPYDLGI